MEGTSIVPERDTRDSAVAGVSGKLPYRKIMVEKFLLNRYPEFPGLIEKGLKAHGLTTDFELKGLDTMTLFVGGPAEVDWEVVRQSILKEYQADACTLGAEVAMIGIVGEGIARNTAIVGAVATALQSAGIHIEAMNFGGSPITLLVAVPVKDYRQALRTLVDTVANTG